MPAGKTDLLSILPALWIINSDKTICFRSYGKLHTECYLGLLLRYCHNQQISIFAFHTCTIVCLINSIINFPISHFVSKGRASEGTKVV